VSTTSGRWTKLYGLLINGLALSLSRDARLLGIEAEAWSDDQETDGVLPRSAVRMLTDAEDPLDPIIAELVAAGRWAVTESGWQIVGFTDRHEDAETREAGRDDEARRLRGYRAHTKGRHNADGPKSCRECAAYIGTNTSTYAGTNDVRTKVDATRREATRRTTLNGSTASPAFGGSAVSPGVTSLQTGPVLPEVMPGCYDCGTVSEDESNWDFDHFHCGVCGKHGDNDAGQCVVLSSPREDLAVLVHPTCTIDIASKRPEMLSWSQVRK
jgi:hypothetical protein